MICDDFCAGTGMKAKVEKTGNGVERRGKSAVNEANRCGGSVETRSDNGGAEDAAEHSADDDGHDQQMFQTPTDTITNINPVDSAAVPRHSSHFRAQPPYSQFKSCSNKGINDHRPKNFKSGSHHI
jgi:hypothetical protein